MCLFLLPITSNSQVWVQKGNDITTSFAGRLISMNYDGSIVAIGINGGASSIGYVSIYEWSGSTWIQKGQNINGTGVGDGFGRVSSLNYTGNTIAIGSPGGSTPYVRICEWNGSNWIQKGQTLYGSNYNSFGSSVALEKDGNIVIIGVPLDDNLNGFGAGKVDVYEWNSSSWVQKGPTLYGDSVGDGFGQSVCITNFSSSGDPVAIAIGAHGNPLTDNTSYVKAFNWNVLYPNLWDPIGSTIYGISPGDGFGQSVSMSSNVGGGELRLAVGGWSGIGENGFVSLYDYNQGFSPFYFQWIRSYYGSGRFGTSVSLNALGNYLAVGAPTFGGSNGKVNIYTHNFNNAWSIEDSIVGNTGEKFGNYVSLSYDGTNVAVSSMLLTVTRVFYRTIVSVVENEFGTNFTYENPTFGNLNIKLGDNYSNIKTNIYNVNGQMLYSNETLNNDNVDIVINGTTGYYFVEIIADNSKRLVIKILKN